MDSLNNFVLQVVVALQKSSEFCEMVAGLENCEFICIFNDLQELMTQKKFPNVMNESFLQMFSTISNENFCFWEVMNLILVQVHEHTTRHLKLSEDFCPYHQVFSIKYSTEYKCDCVSEKEIIEINSIDYPAECSKLVRINQEKVYKNLEWKKYLKHFEDSAIKIYELAKECRNSVCKMIPEYKLKIQQLSKNFLFSVILKDYPNFREILRLFSIFPLVLDFPEFSVKFQVFAFLLISSTKSASLLFDGESNTWVLLIEKRKITGNFSNLIETIFNQQLFPVHVFYSQVFHEILDFRDQNFISLQTIQGLLNKKIPEKMPFLGSRVFKNYSENFWVCECRTVNFSQFCSCCQKGKPKRINAWKCICLKKSFKFQCECQRTIPECELCNGLFSWEEVFCLRCEGFIVLGKCEVCGFRQNKMICPKCLKEFWKCGICFFPNRECLMCFRCGNPMPGVFNGENFPWNDLGFD
jgi:hypothetical protein